MKDELCRAFCDVLVVNEVPAGLAVSTAFRRSDGDAIGFYIVGPDMTGLYRIEDDGFTVTDLESMGADFEALTRVEAFCCLLDEYGARYDEVAGTLNAGPLERKDLPFAAIRFVALLLRIQDLLLMTPERVASTFREDAIQAIREAVGARVTIEENAVVHEALDEFPADVVLRSNDRPPVAVFLAVSDHRVSEAIILHMAAAYEARTPCSVVALLQRDGSVTHRTRQRAANRLAALPIFEGDEKAAASRIAREAIGNGLGLQ